MILEVDRAGFSRARDASLIIDFAFYVSSPKLRYWGPPPSRDNPLRGSAWVLINQFLSLQKMERPLFVLFILRFELQVRYQCVQTTSINDRAACGWSNSLCTLRRFANITRSRLAWRSYFRMSSCAFAFRIRRGLLGALLSLFLDTKNAGAFSLESPGVVRVTRARDLIRPAADKLQPMTILTNADT